MTSQTEMWEIKGKKVAADVFFRLLPLLSENSPVIYLEGKPVTEVREFLEAHAVANPATVPQGTIWPKSRKFNVPCESQVTQALSEMAQRYAEPEICDHVVLCAEGKVVLQAYDFPWLPFVVASEVAEERIALFCKELNCKYRRSTTP